MKDSATIGNAGAERVSLKTLVGAGDKIGGLALPFIVVGVALNVLYPSVFSVGGPSAALRAVSIAVLAVGIVAWASSAYLVLTRVPRHELITTGPFAIVKHPLYTSVSLLVLPWAGFLLNTWLGVLLGAVFYLGSRRYAPEEERQLAETFGAEWDAYVERVWIPWA